MWGGGIPGHGRIISAVVGLVTGCVVAPALC